ncbi:septum formation initiator family protein [Blautia hansenii]|jgi:cell division protein DivIC|uniref:FtsB family cell division protein n=1 Tax=Blautia hansenii TaxID=1322 RepID=UPI0032C0EBB9
MLSITFVVAILFIAMMTQSISVEKQLSQYQQKLEELDNKMTEETERTKEIDDMKEYMETDEYAEEVARDKLGLVKDNEIVFKEQE